MYIAICNLLSLHAYTQEAIEVLKAALTCFLRSDNEQLSFIAAVLLSRAQIPPEDCIKILKHNLCNQHPEKQCQVCDIYIYHSIAIQIFALNS